MANMKEIELDQSDSLFVPNSVLNTNSTSPLVSRRKLASALGESFGGKRDYYEEFGYKKNPTVEDYYRLWDRFDIASRVVEAPAQTTWKRHPRLIPSDLEEAERSKEEKTELEKKWNRMVKRLKIFSKMERLDRLSGIGRYGVMVIGVKGNDGLKKSLESVDSEKDIIYLSPFSEKSVNNLKMVTDPTDRRFGRVDQYEIDMGGNLDSEDIDGMNGDENLTKWVHHSRVIHFAEKLQEDEIFGVPRLKNIINRLEDLRKIVGGSAEMFWQAAERGLHLNAEGDTDLSLDEMEEKVDEYIHELSRVLPTKNMNVEELGGEVKEPSSIFDNIISLISGAKRIPKRILLGSERGDLASKQDQYNWYGRMEERRDKVAEDLVLRPLIDRFMDWGALPERRYDLEWPNLFTYTESEKTDMMKSRAQAYRRMSQAISLGLVTDGEAREAIGLPRKRPEPESIEKGETMEIEESNPETQEQFEKEFNLGKYDKILGSKVEE